MQIYEDLHLVQHQPSSRSVLAVLGPRQAPELIKAKSAHTVLVNQYVIGNLSLVLNKLDNLYMPKQLRRQRL